MTTESLYEISGLKEIFEEKKEDFWEGIETDYWEKENKKELNQLVKNIEEIDQKLTLNRNDFYNEVEKRTEGLSNESSKDIFEDDFKEIEKEEESDIDPFWLS